MIKMQLARPVTLWSVWTPFLQSFPTALLFYGNFFLTLSWTAVVCYQAVVVLHPRDAGSSVTDPCARDVSTLWCGTGIQIFRTNDTIDILELNLQSEKWCFDAAVPFWRFPYFCWSQLSASSYYPNPSLFLVLFLHWYLTAAHTWESFLPLGADVVPAA